MLEAGRDLPQLAAVLRADERREEVFRHRRRGQRRIRIEALEIRARSVLLWSTPMSNAQRSSDWKPCVRPKFANVRGPYSVACG